MCYIHSAALVAEYLKAKNLFPGGCLGFKSISPNLVPDESRVADDEGDTAETRYSQVLYFKKQNNYQNDFIIIISSYNNCVHIKLFY